MPSVAVKVLPPTVTDRLRVSAPAAVVVSVHELPSGETARVSMPAGLGALVQVAGASGVGVVSMGLPELISNQTMVKVTTWPTVTGNMICILPWGFSSTMKPLTTNATRCGCFVVMIGPMVGPASGKNPFKHHRSYITPNCDQFKKTLIRYLVHRLHVYIKHITLVSPLRRFICPPAIIFVVAQIGILAIQRHVLGRAQAHILKKFLKALGLPRRHRSQTSMPRPP